MKQYCRYCANCNPYADDFIYCHIKQILIGEKRAKAVNKCKHFALNPIDAFDLDKVYKPRVAKVEDKNQVKFDLGGLK